MLLALKLTVAVHKLGKKTSSKPRNVIIRFVNPKYASKCLSILNKKNRCQPMNRYLFLKIFAHSIKGFLVLCTSCKKKKILTQYGPPTITFITKLVTLMKTINTLSLEVTLIIYSKKKKT